MISAIILTWNSEKYIKKCIEHLVESVKNADEQLEMIIVDNGSNDGTLILLEDIEKKFPNVCLIKLEKNRGTTYPRNLALKKARGEYVLFLDSDVEIEKNTVKQLLSEIKNNNEIGIVCPKLIYPDGILQISFKKFPTLKTKVFKILATRFSFFKKLADKDELYAERETNFYPDYCISACWLVRKKIFDKIGVFDENIFYAPEDVDFCLRVWLGGYCVLYTSSALAIHHTQRVSYRNKKIALSHAKGLLYYFNKYGCWFSRKGIYRKIKNPDAHFYYKEND
mgnify:FL=1